jgi:gentisate 1,2-dioxygenase
MAFSSTIDRRTQPEYHMDHWPAHVVRKSELDEVIKSLLWGPSGVDGRREALIRHPKAVAPSFGLAPGIAVSIGVLGTTESTVLRRQNASTYTFCLDGQARVNVGDHSYDVGKYDCWIAPSMQPTFIKNEGSRPFVYIEYSNSPVLQNLEAFFSELNPPSVEDQATALETAAAFSAQMVRVKQMVPSFPIADQGAWLMPYEHLIDPEFVESKPLQWRWNDVEPFLGRVRALGGGYNGRPLFCYYNPATGPRNGTTSSFFSTIAAIGPDLVGPAHRHGSAAINLILEGSGWSIVDGERIEWAAGDIMLSAPSWSPHGHATGPEGALVITVQDHPLHIATESLIWQENLNDGPILSLGTQAGFQTNLADIVGGQQQ